MALIQKQREIVSGLEVRGSFLSLPFLLLRLLLFLLPIELFTGNGLYNSLALGSRESVADRTSSELTKGYELPEKKPGRNRSHVGIEGGWDLMM